MSTLVSPAIRSLATGIVKDCGFSSAVLSGIVPDSRHLGQGGYHCSVNDLRSHDNGGDYSNTRPDDKNFNIQYGAAIDVSLNRADMIKLYKRVYRVWADHSDPRRKYINCVNCWDGSGAAVRLDFVTNKAKYASPDHTWHVHDETRRRYANDAKAARAKISMYKGESKATWVAREEGGKPPVVAPKPPTKTPTGHPAGSRILSYIPGKAVMRGEDVAWVQRFIGLERAGKADGVFGAKTRAGVRWYQQMRSLTVDGEVGPATFRSMGIKNNL